MVCGKRQGYYLYLIMLRMLFLGFIFYLLYKLVFDFIIPVSRATAAVRTKVKQMQEEQFRQQQPSTPFTKSTPGTTNTDGEYIDYEEIK